MRVDGKWRGVTRILFWNIFWRDMIFFPSANLCTGGFLCFVYDSVAVVVSGWSSQGRFPGMRGWPGHYILAGWQFFFSCWLVYSGLSEAAVLQVSLSGNLCLGQGEPFLFLEIGMRRPNSACFMWNNIYGCPGKGLFMVRIQVGSDCLARDGLCVHILDFGVRVRVEA